jgi:hypothetical protein
VALPEAERAESAMLLFDVLSGSLMAAYELNQLVSMACMLRQAAGMISHLPATADVAEPTAS